MWIFTSFGFFSVAAHPDNADTLVVRARVEDDLLALRERYLPDIEILCTEQRDYRFRALIARDEWAHALSRIGMDVDYPNFKSAVAQRQGHDRAHRYGEIWSVMYGLQRAAGR